MKIKNSIKMITLSIVASTLFVGCGGGGGSSQSGDNNVVPEPKIALTGKFVDAPVQGLSYKTLTQSGFTDASGQFKYLAGEEVEFILGNLSLGKASAGLLMTPYTISDNNDTAINIALLLQNFDGNRTDTDRLDLSFFTDANLSDVNLSLNSTDMQILLGNLFSDARFATKYSGSVLLDAATVKTAMDTYIDTNSLKFDKKFTQAFLDNNDFYALDDLGPLILRFNNGQLYYAGDSYKNDNGVLVVGAGYDGVFNIDGSGVAAYTLNDGIITIGYGNGSNQVTTKITAVSDTSITVLQKAVSSGTTKTNTWYTDKTVAEIADLNTRGFSVAYLNGKIFYTVYENGEKNTLNFQNGIISIGENLATVTPMPLPNDFTITSDGEIVGKYGNSYATIGEITNKITNVTEAYLDILSTAGGQSMKQRWFYSQTDAQNFTY